MTHQSAVVLLCFAKLWIHGHLLCCGPFAHISYILWGCFTGTRTILWLHHCQWSKSEEYGQTNTDIKSMQHSSKCVLFLRYTILQKRKQAPGLMQYPTLLSNALQLQRGYQWGHLRLIVGKEYCTDWDATNAIVSYYNIVNVPWKQWLCYRIGDFLQNPHNRNTTVHLLW